MSYYWNTSDRRRAMDFGQAQAQLQGQAQDQDTNQRNVFREIGTVHIDIDNNNENIAVAILAVLAFLAGGMDAPEIRAILERLMARAPAAQP